MLTVPNKINPVISIHVYSERNLGKYVTPVHAVLTATNTIEKVLRCSLYDQSTLALPDFGGAGRILSCYLGFEIWPVQ